MLFLAPSIATPGRLMTECVRAPSTIGVLFRVDFTNETATPYARANHTLRSYPCDAYTAP
jgi:hypothetical protein